MLIRPLTASVVDWKGWNTVRSEYGEQPATTNLDRTHVKQSEPHSLIASLHDTVNHSLRNRTVEDLWLCDVGFLLVTDDRRLIAELQAHIKIPLVWSKIYQRGDIEIILKASLWDIYLYVLRLCSEDMLREVRDVGNQIHQFMCQAGCKDLWDTHKRHVLKDGTYVISTR